MGKVINCNFVEGKHLAGKAVCLHCQHTWEAVAPVGTTELECPSCSLLKGVFRAVCCPELRWQCDCGCSHFFVTTTECICCHCGEAQNF